MTCRNPQAHHSRPGFPETKPLASTATLVCSFGHTNGASRIVLQASGQFTPVNHLVGRGELARGSGIPGRDSNVGLRLDARLQANLDADYATLWGLDMGHTGAKPGGILLAVAMCANHVNFGGWV